MIRNSRVKPCIFNKATKTSSFCPFNFFQYATLSTNVKKSTKGLNQLLCQISARQFTILLATYLPILDFNLNDFMYDTG